MSKTNSIKLAFVIAALSSLSALGAGDAMAASTISTPTSIGNSTFSPSSKVTIGVATGFGDTGATCNADPTATNPCNRFAAKAKHSTGNRVVATNNTDSKVYFKTSTSLDAVASATESFTATASWTAM